MNTLFIFLQAAQGGSSLSMWIMIGLIFVVMYFFMIRPQNKQRKELQKFLDGLRKGDKVVTIGGINGVVREVKDTTVIVEVDKDVCITFNKSAIQGPQAGAAPKKDEPKKDKKEEKNDEPKAETK
ncbi:MAG: preprotein translocase subunit YajC [Bacteroidales bacterium]|nr:preprotein translocase subunit YajC [Bacteroidales bacterium]MBQ9598171.1 preprotein translocase subunit YajC [Bacteroidales bacterium]MCR4565534.1 preprotein translocase subunit YajC [Bacteroidales bacterium]